MSLPLVLGALQKMFAILLQTLSCKRLKSLALALLRRFQPTDALGVILRLRFQRSGARAQIHQIAGSPRTSKKPGNDGAKNTPNDQPNQQNNCAIQN
ncbi:MAG TPA: hypothetical protein PLJ62_14525 [Thermoflexales bacterium]|nr:hypothetical protein [Thermoflexales bacterium]